MKAIIIDRMHGDPHPQKKESDITHAAAAFELRHQAPDASSEVENMVGPAQWFVYRLRVLMAFLPHSEVEVRRRLRGVFSSARASQLVAETHQFPPRSHRQRQQQTAQDRGIYV